MAQQNRTTLQALIDLYITTNGNKEITGAQLNEVLTNLNDSAFLQLDELRTALSTSYNPANPSDWNVLPTEVKAALDEAISRVEGLENAGFQTAVQTPYTATTSTDWDPEGAPTEVRGGLDILATRTSKNPSQDVAFVSNDGDDLTGERGNSLKPYATIQAAADAVPVNDSKVIVLGGLYSGGLSTTKNNFTLDITSCEINDRILIDGDNNTVIGYGAKVTTSNSAAIININATNFTVKGGEYIGVGVPAYRLFTSATNIVIKDAKLTSDASTVNGQNIQLLNCEIIRTTATGTAPAVSIGGDVFLSNCKVSGGRQGIITGAGTKLTIDNNCEIEGTETPIKTSGALTAGEQNMDLKNSTLTGGSFGIGLFREVQDINIKNCIIDAPDAFLFIDTLRVGNAVNFIQGCKLLCTQVVNVSSYNGSDVGTINFINCSTRTAIVTGAKVIEFNTYLNANL
jgi:hypothetical protein